MSTRETINFTLPVCNATFQALRAEMEKHTPTTLGLSICDAVVEVGLADFRNVFKFTMKPNELENEDVTDKDTDILFRVDAPLFAVTDASGLGHANMHYPAQGAASKVGDSGLVITRTPYTKDTNNNNNDDNVMLLNYDAVRDIASKSFGYPFASYTHDDGTGTQIRNTEANVRTSTNPAHPNPIASTLSQLYNNEQEVRRDVHDKVKALTQPGGSIYEALNAANLNTSLEGDVQHESNIGRILLNTMRNHYETNTGTDGSRFDNFRNENLVISGSPNTNNSLYHMPFIAGDTITFLLNQDNTKQRDDAPNNSSNAVIDRQLRVIFVICTNPVNVYPGDSTHGALPNALAAATNAVAVATAANLAVDAAAATAAAAAATAAEAAAAAAAAESSAFQLDTQVTGGTNAVGGWFESNQNAITNWLLLMGEDNSYSATFGPNGGFTTLPIDSNGLNVQMLNNSTNKRIYTWGNGSSTKYSIQLPNTLANGTFDSSLLAAAGISQAYVDIVLSNVQTTGSTTTCDIAINKVSLTT